MPWNRAVLPALLLLASDWDLPQQTLTIVTGPAGERQVQSIEFKNHRLSDKETEK